MNGSAVSRIGLGVVGETVGCVGGVGVATSEVVQAVAAARVRRVRRKTILRGVTSSPRLIHGVDGQDVEEGRRGFSCLLGWACRPAGWPDEAWAGDRWMEPAGPVLPPRIQFVFH